MEVEAIRETLHGYPKSMKQFENWYQDTHSVPFDDLLKLPEWAIVGVARQFIQETNEQLTTELWDGEKSYPSNDIYRFVVKAFQMINSNSPADSTKSPSKGKKNKKGK